MTSRWIRSMLLLVFVACFGIAFAQTLSITNWPVRPMPSAEDRAANPAREAYAQALESWLAENPGVNIEFFEGFSIWNQQALLTGIAGGTAPSFYNANVLGGWAIPAIRAAFMQDLAADTTEALANHNIIDRLAPPVRALWESWQVNGRYYGAPESVVTGLGVYYRKDLIDELGLQEPQPGWTWDDFHELARALTTDTRRGAVLQPYIPNLELDANGWQILTLLPAPQTNWNWRWDYTSDLDTWTPILERWRTAIHEEGNFIIEPTGINDGVAAEAFHRGDAAMMFNNYFWFAREPSDPLSMASLADRLGRPIEEVVGWVEFPRGSRDLTGFSTPTISTIAFNPDLSADQLDKAMSLFEYMYFGDGFVSQRQALWEQTEDLRFVYTVPFPINGMMEIPGVPGTFADAWGQQFADNVMSSANVPIRPDRGLYIPAESDAGPDQTAFNDAMSTILFNSGEVNIATEFANAERIMNQQAASFRSSVSDSVFVETASEYFSDLDSFVQQHSPEWHADVFSAWHEAYVAPALTQ